MTVALSQADIQDLRGKGYSDQEIQVALKEIEQEELNKSYATSQQQSFRDPRNNSQVSTFSSRSSDDLVKWQLELNDILERTDHILKGDIAVFKEGHIIWEKNPNPERNSLSEYGVQEIMKIFSMYINRNTILSDYTNDEIKVKVFDFGREINNLIFMRDDEFGLNTEEKRKSYPMLVREMVDIVHSAYKRALDGSEKRSLREMINISQATNTQSQLGSGVTINNQGQLQKERGLLNPLRWVKGRSV